MYACITYATCLIVCKHTIVIIHLHGAQTMPQNPRSIILDELRKISIDLQYMPTMLNDSAENQKYFHYFERALELRKQLSSLKDSGTFAPSFSEPVNNEGEGSQ